MRLVTVATHPGGYFKYLQQSCDRHGAKLDVLGWNQTWKGFQWKFQLMNEYLKSLPDDEVVCFVDSFDVILLRPLTELETLFRSVSKNIGAKIIVGCDKITPTIQRVVVSPVFWPCQNKYLNSGTYIGLVRDIKQLIAKTLAASNDPKSDDQMNLIKICRGNESDFYIDCDNMFFITHVNMFGTTFMNAQMKVINGQLMVDGSRPFLAHGPGSTNMNILLRELGYFISPAEVKRLQSDRLKAYWRGFQHWAPICIPIIIFIIIFCCALTITTYHLLKYSRRLQA